MKTAATKTKRKAKKVVATVRDKAHEARREIIKARAVAMAAPEKGFFRRTWKIWSGVAAAAVGVASIVLGRRVISA